MGGGSRRPPFRIVPAFRRAADRQRYPASLTTGRIKQPSVMDTASGAEVPTDDVSGGSRDRADRPFASDRADGRAARYASGGGRKRATRRRCATGHVPSALPIVLQTIEGLIANLGDQRRSTWCFSVGHTLRNANRVPAAQGPVMTIHHTSPRHLTSQARLPVADADGYNAHNSFTIQPRSSTT